MSSTAQSIGAGPDFMPMHSRPSNRYVRNLGRLLVGGIIVLILMGLAVVGTTKNHHHSPVTAAKTTFGPMTLPEVPSGRKAFHVSPDGDDDNPGTLARPWRTVARAMVQRYSAGDQLLFRRGGQYFGTIDQIPVPNGSHRWLIGAYGEGPRPIISNAKLLDNPTAWMPAGPDLWRIDLADPATHGGWTDPATNIGFLRTGSDVHGAKKKSLDELHAQWDFYDDDRFLYVHSTANPTTLAPDLRAAPDSVLIRLHSNMEVSGLELEDCGGHAMRSEVTPVVNVQILDNYIHHIGGSFLIGYADDKVRYGNGIECLDSCTDWLVQGNVIHDVYDSGFTCQGSGTWNNIRVTQNQIYDNSHNLEFWTKKPGGGLENVLIDDNDFGGGGGGWGGLARPDQENNAQFISYGWELPADIHLTNNRIRGARGAYVYFAPETGYPHGWVFADNDIQLAEGTLMQYGQPFTIEDAAAWAAANHTEAGSTFEVSGNR